MQIHVLLDSRGRLEESVSVSQAEHGFDDL